MERANCGLPSFCSTFCATERTRMFCSTIFDTLSFCVPAGTVVIITSTLSSGTRNPLTPMISSTLTAIARFPGSRRTVNPAPSPASLDSRTSSCERFMSRSNSVRRAGYTTMLTCSDAGMPAFFFTSSMAVSSPPSSSTSP